MREEKNRPRLLGPPCENLCRLDGPQQLNSSAAELSCEDRLIYDSCQTRDVLVTLRRDVFLCGAPPNTRDRPAVARRTSRRAC